MTRSHTIAAFILFTSPAIAQEQAAQPVTLDRDAIVATHLTPIIDAYQIPGAMVGMYVNGELSFHSIGSIDFGVEQAPDENTLYEIGSIGKVFTGVFFADAIRRGEVTKNTTLQELMPEGFQVSKGDDGSEIQLWHLTSHSSGWGPVPINFMPNDPDVPFGGYTEKMLTQGLAGTPLNRNPGSGFEYSNFAVGTLGTVLARNAKGNYEDLVRERVLEPLGITNFAIELSDEQKARLATPTNGGITTKPWGQGNPFAPAGLWSATAPELMRFAMANLESEEEREGEIYESLDAAREMLFDTGSFGKVGFGWFLALDGSSYWHNGQTGGFSSYMAVNRELDAALVVLTNGATMYTTSAGEKIFQSMLGLMPQPVALEVPERIEEAHAQRLVGTYNSAMGFAIEVTTANGLVYARVTGQQAFRVDKVGENRFRYGIVEAELGFELLEGDGPATSVTLFQGGQEFECKRAED